MKIEFDPQKNAANFDKHGLRFEDVATLEWESAHFALDDRRFYGEERLIAYVMRDARLYIVCLTFRGDDVIRVFSFRKANKRERLYYEQETIEQ